MKLKCKKCGNDKYFYVKERFSGETEVEVDNLGNWTDYNAGAYDGMECHLRSIFYYCEECDSKVARIPEDRRY